MGFRTEQPRRILLVRNDRIGDLVLTLPAIAAVRRNFPHAHVAVLASPAAAPLLTASRDIDELLIDEPAVGPWQLGRRLKAMRFDTSVVFNTNTRNCLAVWRAGIRRRVCWAYKPAGLLLGNRRVALHRSHPPIHEASFAMAFVRRLGVAADVASYRPRLEIDRATHERVAGRIADELGTDGPLFGVHPGNKNSAYNWPEPHFAQLIGRLARHGRVMVTGSAEEQSLLERIGGRLTEGATGRIGFFANLHLIELAAALSQQTSLTVSSTGPMHVAAVVGTPVVGLFSPHPVHSPIKWAPLGAGHTLLVAPLEAGEDPRMGQEKAAMVMGRISVDRAVEANLNYAERALMAAEESKQ